MCIKISTYILSLSLSLYIYIYIYIYIESNFTVLFLCSTKLSLKPPDYHLHVQSYTCQSSYKREKFKDKDFNLQMREGMFKIHSGKNVCSVTIVICLSRHTTKTKLTSCFLFDEIFCFD